MVKSSLKVTFLAEAIALSLGLLVLLYGCMPASEFTPAKEESSVPNTPDETPTSLSAITVPSATSIPPTLIPTLSPTSTQIPGFVWESDFESGFSGWNFVHQQGGSASIVDDPTDSGRGKVFEAIIGQGNPPKSEAEFYNAYPIYRLYPDIYFSYVEGPCEVHQDIWISKEILLASKPGTSAQIAGGFTNTVVIGPDIFSINSREKARSSLQVKLIYMSTEGSRGKYILFFANHASSRASFEEDLLKQPSFSSGEWHKLSIYFDESGNAALYSDGELVNESWIDGRGFGLIGGHPGLYIHNAGRELISGGRLLIDNYVMKCWGEVRDDIEWSWEY